MFFGVYGGRVHLFPFRTEKLSQPAQMVLSPSGMGEYVDASFYKTLFIHFSVVIV